MTLSISTEDIADRYNNIVSTIEKILGFQIEVLQNKNSDFILERSEIFYRSLEDKDLFNLFVSNKIKVFSSKSETTQLVSESLFGRDLLLKNVFNNRTEDQKLKLWDLMLNFYKFIESNNDDRSNRIEVINNRLDLINKGISDSIKKNILNVDVNDKTSNMIDDIVGCFQNLVNDNKNPFESIMDVTTKISEKYFKDIENGDVEIDKIVSNISLDDVQKTFMNQQPEKKPVVIDENFSTANVDEGQEEEQKNMFGDILGMAGKMPDITKLTGMLNKIQDADDDEDVLKVKEEMDEYLSSQFGIDVSKLNDNISKMMEHEDNGELDELNTKLEEYLSNQVDNNEEN